MAWGDAVSLAALLGVVFAIWYGRRRGRARFAASIADARADAAATAVAELTAQFHNVVQVHNGGSPGLTREQRYEQLADDIRTLGLNAHVGAAHLGTAPEYYDLDHDDHGAAWLGGLAERSSDDELAPGWGARTVDRNGALRRVGDDSAVM